jgi:hypothetical protein
MVSLPRGERMVDRRATSAAPDRCANKKRSTLTYTAESDHSGRVAQASQPVEGEEVELSDLLLDAFCIAGSTGT